MPGTAPEKHRNFDFGQVFPRNYLMLWHVENHEILDFFMIFMIFSIFHRKRGKSFPPFSENLCFRTRAAGCRECCLNQWNTIHFGGSWAPWARFLRKSAFLMKFCKNVENVKNHWILHFQWKSRMSWNSWHCKKHQYFLRNIKVLEPPDSQKSRISINFMIFMKFLEIS